MPNCSECGSILILKRSKKDKSEYYECSEYKCAQGEIEENDEELRDGEDSSLMQEFRVSRRTSELEKERSNIEKAGPQSSKGKAAEHDYKPCSVFHPGQTHYAWRNPGCLTTIGNYFRMIFGFIIIIIVISVVCNAIF